MSSLLTTSTISTGEKALPSPSPELDDPAVRTCAGFPHLPLSTPTQNPVFLIRPDRHLRSSGTLTSLSPSLRFQICNLYLPKCFWKPHLPAGMMPFRSNKPQVLPKSSWAGDFQNWGQALYDLLNTTMSVFTHHTSISKPFWKLILPSTSWASVFPKLFCVIWKSEESSYIQAQDLTSQAASLSLCSTLALYNLLCNHMTSLLKCFQWISNIPRIKSKSLPQPTRPYTTQLQSAYFSFFIS